MYQLQFLNKSKSQPVQNLTARGNQVIQNLIQEIKDIGATSTQFQQLFQDYTDAKLQFNDLLSKYHTDDGSKLNGGYRLPALMNDLPSFNSNSMKEDNAKINDLKKITQELENQKSIYFNMIVRFNTRILSLLKDLNKIDQDLDIMIDSINPLV